MMPPPPVDVLPERVELEMVRVPLVRLLMPPPPTVAVLPERVELVTVRMPELLKAPPLPETCAPETVTPEMERLPPVLMVKILKPPAIPLMISEEAPGPVMVRVPAEAAMEGRDDNSWTVVTPVLKTISSLPGDALASVIACRREPEKASLVFRTVKVAGTILCSRLRSSSLDKPEALRAFLFGELLKSLRKAFKSMESVPIIKPKKEANRRVIFIGGSKNLNPSGSNRM